MAAYKGPTHSEYMRAVQAAEEALSESMHLRRRNAELEGRLQAVELTPERVYDAGTHDLTRLAAHYHTLLAAIVDELRARHHDVAEELIEPRVRALAAQLGAAKEGMWDARQRAHDLEAENSRLLSALEKLADVQPEPPREPAREPGRAV